MIVKLKINYNHLGETFNNKYPYKYRIDISYWQAHERELVWNWLDEIQLPCTIAGDGLYVHDIDDVTLFLLRWS